MAYITIHMLSVYIFIVYMDLRKKEGRKGGKEKGREGRKKGGRKTESVKGTCWSCQQAGVDGKETEDRQIN